MTQAHLSWPKRNLCWRRTHVGWGSLTPQAPRWYLGESGTSTTQYLSWLSSLVVPSERHSIIASLFGTDVIGLRSTRTFGKAGYGPSRLLYLATPYNGYPNLASVPFALQAQPIASGFNLVTTEADGAFPGGRGYVLVSSDGGANWSAAPLIAPPITDTGDPLEDPTHDYYEPTVSAPGVTRLANGRLIIGGRARRADKWNVVSQRAAVYYSDDNGFSWTGVAVLGLTDNRYRGEFTTHVWQNGDVYVANQNSGGKLWASSDNGETWAYVGVPASYLSVNWPWRVTPLASGRILISHWPGVPATSARSSYSDNNGLSVTLLTSGWSCGTVVGNRVYVRAGDMLKYSDDECNSWSDLLALATGDAGAWKNLLALDAGLA